MSTSERQIAIAASFVAEPVEQPLSFWLRELEMPYPIVFAPYNQVFQQLLDPASALSANANGINIILLRLEDWQRDEADGAQRKIEDNAHELVRALTAAVSCSTAIHFLFLCPPSPRAAVEREQTAAFERAEELIITQLSAVPGVHVVSSAALAAAYPVAEYCDALADQLAHIPYTTLAYTALGTAIARKIHALKNSGYKVIVVDGDQTLWDGVCGEDGPLGIRMCAERQAVQEFLLEQHNRGMLLCLCSMNNEEDIADVFRQRPEMPLKREHFAGWQANWRAKSENIKALAADLNVGLDSLIFIDDDDVACAEVRAHCPEVLTLQLPRLIETIPSFLRHLWVFDRLQITDEAAGRTALYQQQAQREQLREQLPTLSDFLTSLDLQIEIAPMSSEQLARVSELTLRTNQFNFTTIRRSEVEIQALCRAGAARCLVVYVADRFGDYGLVGAMIFKSGSNTLSVDTFLLSCRALGRGVEYRMLAALGAIAQEHGLGAVDLAYSQTPKNRPAFDFLNAVAADFKQPESDGRSLFRIPTALAQSLSFNPSAATHDHGGARENSIAPLAPATAAPSAWTRAARFSAIALERSDAEQIQKAISAQARARPALATSYVAPRSLMEEKLSGLWSELLDVDQIGINDNFFELGGHSLLAMQLLSRIRDVFQVELGLRSLFTDQFTVADLAKSVLEQQIQAAGEHDVTTMLREIDELSDVEVKALLAMDADHIQTP